MSGRLAPLGPAALSVGAGVCLWASFAPLHLWPSAVLGVALLVAALRGRGFCASFACGFATGAVFFGLLCDWATEAAGTWIARAGLGGVLALYIGVLALVWQAFLRAWGGCAQATTGTGKAKDPKATAGKAAAAGKACAWKLVPALAVVWVAVEDLQGTWPEGGMPWGKLAFGQVEGPLVHLAPYGSTELVSFAVVAASTSAANVPYVVNEPRKPVPRSRRTRGSARGKRRARRPARSPRRNAPARFTARVAHGIAHAHACAPLGRISPIQARSAVPAQPPAKTAAYGPVSRRARPPTRFRSRTGSPCPHCRTAT